MIKVNGTVINTKKFPDGTPLIKYKVDRNSSAKVEWFFDDNEELINLIFIVKHLKANGIKDITLYMPYIPNARQDRVKQPEDVFTLKYFAEVINSLEFSKVKVLDPHSYVSEALINNIEVESPKALIEEVIFDKLPEEIKSNLTVFYPDEGAMKRYTGLIGKPYVFGAKDRDWQTGRIKGLTVIGDKQLVKDKPVLIIDDICSKGGTFYFSALELKNLGAKNIYLYVTHCENSIFDGELLKTDLVEKIFTTNSTFNMSNNKIDVYNLRGINSEE